MQALVVNFLVGPGGGKTTLAHRVYADLKEQGQNVYLVPDFAAMHVFAHNQSALVDQIARVAETTTVVENAESAGHAVLLLENPQLMHLMYAQDQTPPYPYMEALGQLLRRIVAQRPSLNLMLERSSRYVYDEKSRHVDLSGARLVDQRVIDYMKQYDVPYVNVPDLPTAQRSEFVIQRINNALLTQSLSAVFEEPSLDEPGVRQPKAHRSFGK